MKSKFNLVNFLIGFLNVVISMYILSFFVENIIIQTTELSVLKIIAQAVLVSPIIVWTIHIGVLEMARQIANGLGDKKC